MRKTMLSLLFVCGFVSACATQSQVVTTPDTLEYNFGHDEKIYVEVHNSHDWCIVRIWSPTKNEDSPLAILRGSPGQNTCQIYSVVNPGIAPSDKEVNR